MGLPQRTFFTVQEVAIRWDCSLDDLAGWAINGKPEVVMAIEPIQQNGTICQGWSWCPWSISSACSGAGPAGRNAA